MPPELFTEVNYTGSHKENLNKFQKTPENLPPIFSDLHTIEIETINSSKNKRNLQLPKNVKTLSKNSDQRRNQTVIPVYLENSSNSTTYQRFEVQPKLHLQVIFKLFIMK